VIKKILHKKKSKQQAEKLPTRITNDTVAEHREKVLAGGRKLKYPLQYTKRNLVRNTAIISVAGLLVLTLATWVQLYVVKDTSDLAYRVTRVIPLPVAVVDGQPARYSDYLLYYRSTVLALDGQGWLNIDNARDKILFQQKQALDLAIEDAYATKLATEKNIEITDAQVDELLNQQRKNSGLSDSAYEASVRDTLHWSMNDMRQALKASLLRQEIAFTIDEKARDTSKEVEGLIGSKKSLSEIAQKLGDKVQLVPNVVVPKNNSDGGLSIAVSNLEIGKVSSAIKTSMGDGYYFVLRQPSDDSNLKYSYILVPLTEFKNQLDKLKGEDKVRTFISLDDN